MFGFVNVGECAGSGVDKIMTAWAEQNWKKPEFDFSERNERVTLSLKSDKWYIFRELLI